MAAVHRKHPTLTDNQVMAASRLAELPLGMTWKQKAAKIGVQTVTLWTYRQVPEFIELVVQISRENLRAEIPGAYEAMVQGMHRGGGAGAKYLELFFKVTGEITDQEQAQALKGWLDAVADCSSDMLLVAIRKTTGIAPVNAVPPGSRVVAPAANMAQIERMELTEHPASELCDDGQGGGGSPAFSDPLEL